MMHRFPSSLPVACDCVSALLSHIFSGSFFCSLLITMLRVAIVLFFPPLDYSLSLTLFLFFSIPLLRRGPIMFQNINVQLLHDLDNEVQALHQAIDGHAKHAVRGGFVVYAKDGGGVGVGAGAGIAR